MIKLPWGATGFHLDLPQQRHIAGEMMPSPYTPAPDVAVEKVRSLRVPFGSGRITELPVKRGGRVAIINDDSRRPTPVRDILPGVLASLARRGITRDQIPIIPAIGLQRPVSIEAFEARSGVAGLRVENPACDNTPRSASVLVLPHGGGAYPILPNPDKEKRSVLK
ncbi:MAG TPA: lactate racemase domain-containing protein [Levilinea sp.]|nr:lactate racemase domain-containing protein [Levilinea sp.]